MGGSRCGYSVVCAEQELASIGTNGDCDVVYLLLRLLAVYVHGTDEPAHRADTRKEHASCGASSLDRLNRWDQSPSV